MQQGGSFRLLPEENSETQSRSCEKYASFNSNIYTETETSDRCGTGSPSTPHPEFWCLMAVSVRMQNKNLVALFHEARISAFNGSAFGDGPVIYLSVAFTNKQESRRRNSTPGCGARYRYALRYRVAHTARDGRDKYVISLPVAKLGGINPLRHNPMIAGRCTAQRSRQALILCAEAVSFLCAAINLQRQDRFLV